MADRRRFGTLDALRGIAALCVMFRHTIDSPMPLPGGYVAVDLFFGLSGFVMALSYEDRLRGGLSLGQFMALRVARLWPMLIIGAALGVVLFGGWPGMIVLLPDPWSATGALYPTNGSLWSLLFEMIAYLGFALLAPRLALRGVVATVALCGLALGWLALVSELWIGNFGGFWVTLPHGLLRVGFSFSCGVLFYRLRAETGLPQVTSGAAWLLPAGLVLLVVLTPAPGQVAGVLAILVALPALLWLATKWEIPQTRLAARLSDLSYPLYCIHVPLLVVAWELGLPAVPTWAGLIALGLLLDRCWDRPLRRMMREVAVGRRGPMQAA
jgi:peptidoglycan/LPS O-acetylase OafA/YrhL